MAGERPICICPKEIWPRHLEECPRVEWLKEPDKGDFKVNQEYQDGR